MPAACQKDNPLYAVNLACGLAADFNQCIAKCEICCEKPQKESDFQYMWRGS